MEQDINTCLHNLIRLAAHACQVPAALINVRDGETLQLSINFGLETLSWQAELPFCTHARLGSSLFVVKDAQSDSRFAEHPLVKDIPHINFYAGMPIIVAGRVIGTFSVIDYAERSLSAEQEETIKLLTQQTVLLLQTHIQTTAKLTTIAEQTEYLRSKAQFFQTQIEHLEQENYQIQLLSRLSLELQTAATFDRAYQAIAPLLPLLFPGCAGNIFMGLETHWNIAESVLTWGDSQRSRPTEVYLNNCQALASHHDRHSDHNAVEYCLCCHQEKLIQEKKLICLPINNEDDILGVLHLYPTSQQPWSGDYRLFVAKVVNQLAIAFKNLKILQSFQLKSIRDSLTGLFNRRYFEEILERLLNRSEQGDDKISLLMLDIDFFKRINDTFGHLAGDAVLKDTGIFLKGSVRPTDIACRYGGEEFAIILPACPIKIAEQRAENLRRGIQFLSMEYQGQNLGHITISCGVATFPDHASTLTELIDAADRALYQAKVNGRDRICVTGVLTR